MRALIAALVFVSLGVACASAHTNAPTSSFVPSDAALFDDAVDRVESPVIVESHRNGVFERRVARADAIVAVDVTSIRSEVIRRRSAYRIDVEVEDTLKGSTTRDLVLHVADDEPGYPTVEMYEDVLLHDPFIAFIKWEQDPASGALIAHWHLSPDTAAVREKVAFALARSASAESS